MSLPLDVILESLESSPKSIIPILATLHRDKALLNDISKTDLKHLVSRSLNLSKSPIVYNKWCGINLIRILGNNYNILANEGVNFVSQLLKILENCNQSSDPKILSSTVECLNSLCDQIRGKPTLTREVLTPRLPTIITLYMEKIAYHPSLIIGSLNSLIRKHPTTFRPYGNKLRNRLIEFLSSESYKAFPQDLKQLICETLATLPIIEKTEPDAKWQGDIVDIVKELSQVLLIYDEFLNLNDDSDLMELFKKIPQTRESEAQGLNFKFASLEIDINKPDTIFQISDRVELLLSIMKAYLVSETQFSVRVPIGLVLIINEIICSISTKFVPFKKDIRDEKVKKIIKSTTLINQLNSLNLLSELPIKYQGSLIPHLNNILAFLEILIPFSNKRIDYQEVLSNEIFMCKLLDCTGNFLSLVSSLSDASLLIRFIDVALCLVEERTLNSSPVSDGKKQNHQVNGNRKKNKKKNKESVPLSDLLSHQHLFNETIPSSTLKSTRRFVNIVITRVSLPPTQHYRVFRYLIIEATVAKSYNKDQIISQELKHLLINSVLYPGFEKNSMLPIVTSLLGDDPLLSVFNNPRFPPLPTYIKKSGLVIEDDEEESETEDEEMEQNDNDGSLKVDEEFESSTKRRKIDTSESSVGGNEQPEQNLPKIVPEDSKTNEKIFTNVNPELIIQFAETSEKVEDVVPEPEATRTEVLTESTSEAVPTLENQIATSITVDKDENDDSDFEMPDIVVGDDDSDDE
ncbi:Pre-rRNA-processing protein RIX1 [Debaryomyces fabryi]|uniref:Pre-rRNA-processing protein RIX1 n=1 Tax=Debaryomyces fabryi TaxID=58627 RepID=A0A0V1Q588_9ASCO|nr:Pre-rRNA-processing protein RIX1 [Debaryomyces fabryi]KSA03613.1 Pre-rRNA-processing protein RIX1 [Debaryomyces fabryi]CUM52728.1 unnamed protein product [Debaryomyces fabryi]